MSFFAIARRVSTRGLKIGPFSRRQIVCVVTPTWWASASCVSRNFKRRRRSLVPSADGLILDSISKIPLTDFSCTRLATTLLLFNLRQRRGVIAIPSHSDRGHAQCHFGMFHSETCVARFHTMPHVPYFAYVHKQWMINDLTYIMHGCIGELRHGSPRSYRGSLIS
jgi:hypothetical protein